MSSSVSSGSLPATLAFVVSSSDGKGLLPFAIYFERVENYEDNGLAVLPFFASTQIIGCFISFDVLGNIW